MGAYRNLKRGSLALAVALTAGCAWYDQNIAKNPLFDVTRVSKQEDAGSCHVAVLSVARWETYPAVQPQFSLTADQAFTQAIPDTSIIENKLLSSTAVQVSGQVGTGAGTPPTVAAVVPGNGLADLPGTGATLSQLGQDPILRYWAATALYEEVQILNRYLKDAAVSDQYYPFLIRAQVTVMPKRRNLPYDAYTSMSFFVDDFADYPPVKRLVGTELVKVLLSEVRNEYVNSQWDRYHAQQQLLPDYAVKLLMQPPTTLPSTSQPAPPPSSNRSAEPSESPSVKTPRNDGIAEQIPSTLPAASAAQGLNHRSWDPLALREALVKKLELLSAKDVHEVVSIDAIVDGLKIASARPAARTEDSIESALAYARDRSPRFAGFRGQDLSDYFDTGKLSDKQLPPAARDRIANAMRDYQSSVREFGETCIERNCEFTLIPPGCEDSGKVFTIPNIFAFRAPCAKMNALCAWKNLPETKQTFGVDTNNLVSIDDLIITLNESTSLLKSQTTSDDCMAVLEQLVNSQANWGSNFRPYVPSPRPQTPVVIPLVVTDDLQSAIESRSAEQIRQIALSLAAAAGKANVGGGLTNLDEQLRNTLGRSLDSTFTIARQADNTIRARFGASLQAGSRYAMVPEAHNVTLLILVPKVYMDTVRKPCIHMETSTDFVDAETGQALPEKHGTEKDAFVMKVLEREGLKLNAGTPADLLYDAADNNMDDFKARLGGDTFSCEKVWNLVLAWYNAAPDGFVSIPLEKPSNPSIPVFHDNLPDKRIAALDDGKKNLTVSVLGEGNLFQQSISAELWAITPPGAIAHTVKVESDSVELNVSVDSNGKMSLATTKSATVIVDPGADGVAISQPQKGTIDFPKTQPATVRVGPNDQIAITRDGQGKLDIKAKGKDVLTASNTTSVAKDADKRVVLWSTATAIGEDKRTITFTFPSLAAMDLASPTKKPQLFMKVHFFRADNDEIPALAGDNLVPLDYQSQKSKTLTIKLIAQAKVINAKADGTGELYVTVSGFDPASVTSPIYLSVDGGALTAAAKVVSASGSSPPSFQNLIIASDNKHAGKVAITSNGVMKLSLQGLNPIANVTVSADDDAGAKIETPITEIVDHAYHSAANIVESNLTTVNQERSHK